MMRCTEEIESRFGWWITTTMKVMDLIGWLGRLGDDLDEWRCQGMVWMMKTRDGWRWWLWWREDVMWKWCG